MKSQGKIDFSNIEEFSSKGTITASNTCVSQQIISQLERNEKLKIQLFRAHQTIRQLKEKNKFLQTKEIHNISFQQDKGASVENIWKQNYNNLTLYIGEYMSDANFLAEKCFELQKRCSRFEEQNSYLQGKQSLQVKQQQQLLKVMETKMNEKISETEKLIQGLVDMNKEKDYIIVELQRVIEEKTRQSDELEIRYEREFSEVKRDIFVQKQTNSKNMIRYEEQMRVLRSDKQILVCEQLKKEKMIEQLRREIEKNRREKSLILKEGEEDKLSYQDIVNCLREKIQIQEREYSKQIAKLCDKNNELSLCFYEKEEEVKKGKAVLLDMQIRVNQKQRQIQELQEIKELQIRKYMDLQDKNKQLISDIETVIEQLKIRQLQIEKLQKESEEITLKLINSQSYDQSETKKIFELKFPESENFPLQEVREKNQKLPKFSLEAFQKKIIFSRTGYYQSNRKIR